MADRGAGGGEVSLVALALLRAHTTRRRDGPPHMIGGFEAALICGLCLFLFLPFLIGLVLRVLRQGRGRSW
ncbi:MAG: hypothetical protein Kow00124_21660 [Anaerolineae bacterium]